MHTILPLCCEYFYKYLRKRVFFQRLRYIWYYDIRYTCYVSYIDLYYSDCMWNNHSCISWDKTFSSISKGIAVYVCCSVFWIFPMVRKWLENFIFTYYATKHSFLKHCVFSFRDFITKKSERKYKFFLHKRRTYIFTLRLGHNDWFILCNLRSINNRRNVEKKK